MKNLIKTLTIAVLTAAIVLTGIVIPNANTTTVNAKTTNGTFENGSTITLKPGDTIKLLVTDTKHEFNNSELNDYDITSKYKWSSSDKSVVKVETDFYNEKEGSTECIVVTGVGAGTATVTGDCKSWQPNITMTFNVTLPKPTAKQKKCKHSYKTTKKATCECAGIKTCKKCKYQKAIKKINHKYVNTTITGIGYRYYIEHITCSGCDCPTHDPNGPRVHTNPCTFECQIKYEIKYDANGKEQRIITPDSEYQSFQEAVDAIMDHQMFETKGKHYSWGAGALTALGSPEPITRIAKICKYCGEEKK